MQKKPEINDRVLVVRGKAKGQFGKVVRGGVSVDGQDDGALINLEDGGQSYFPLSDLKVVDEDKDEEQLYNWTVFIEKIDSESMKKIKDMLKEKKIRMTTRAITKVSK